VAAVPRLTTRLGAPDRFPLGTGAWQETVLELAGLPEGTQFRNIFTGAAVTASCRRDGTAVIRAADLFSDFPVALLLNK
jgi:maltooligosyltrehalose synthase